MTAAQDPLTLLTNDVATTARAIPGTTGRCYSWATPIAAGSSPKPVRQPHRDRPNVCSDLHPQPRPVARGGAAAGPRPKARVCGPIRPTSSPSLPKAWAPTWARRAAAVPGLPQPPLAARATLGKVTAAAWQTKTSRYIIADDRTANPDIQRAVAQKINATTRPGPGSYLLFVMTQPALIAPAIIESAQQIGT